MDLINYLTLNPWLTYNEFLEALELYRSLQSEYLSTKDITKLNGLESWFINVIEPAPEDITERKHWFSREMYKKQGHSYYCSPEAKKLVYVDVKDRQKVIQLVIAINSTLH